MESEKFELSYSALWRSIIRPPRDEYCEDHLGENIFIYRGKTYIRKDYNIIDQRGHILKSSFIEPDDDSRVNTNKNYSKKQTYKSKYFHILLFLISIQIFTFSKNIFLFFFIKTLLIIFHINFPFYFLKLFPFYFFYIIFHINFYFSYKISLYNSRSHSHLHLQK